MPAPFVDLGFAHHWQAEMLATRPLILPPRHFVYPADAEEVERGALEVLVRPEAGTHPFLATCALGFRDPAVPTGLWSCPRPEEMCAVSGGYAYIIDTIAPECSTMILYRPVLAVHAVIETGLLLFVGHRNILAWGAKGEAWQTEKLSDEGVTITGIEGNVLSGLGWNLITDKEIEFSVDIRTGLLLAGG